MPGTKLRTEELSTGSEQHLLKYTKIKNRIFMDVFCLAILILYLGIVFVFSSYFYLATEDYEAVTAVETIRAGQLIGKSTGWPYTPLAAYLYLLVFARIRQRGFRFSTRNLLTHSVGDSSHLSHSAHNLRTIHGLCLDAIVPLSKHLSSSAAGVFH